MTKLSKDIIRLSNIPNIGTPVCAASTYDIVIVGAGKSLKISMTINGFSVTEEK